MYSRSELIIQFNKGERLKYLLFWGHKPSKDGSINKSCFSQWWPSSFEVDGLHYPTAEHWMMAKKASLFEDEIALEKILKAKSPAQAKKIGREVLKFDAKHWDNNKFEFVVEGNSYKFSQNTDLKQFLLNTKNRILVEASPVDKIWGVGMAQDHPNIENPVEWKGENLLGFALMKVRNQLKI